MDVYQLKRVLEKDWERRSRRTPLLEQLYVTNYSRQEIDLARICGVEPSELINRKSWASVYNLCQHKLKDMSPEELLAKLMLLSD